MKYVNALFSCLKQQLYELVDVSTNVNYKFCDTCQSKN